MATFIILAIVLSVVLFVVFSNKDDKVQKNESRTTSLKLDDRTMMDIAKKVDQNGQGNYWQSFKIRKPKDAKAIEKLCCRDMEAISDAAAFQIVSSFLRWSNNSGTSIDKLKETFIEQMDSLITDGATFDMLIDRIKTEKSKEAKQFNISEDFTICSFMYEWLVEMKNKQDHELMTERMASGLNIPKEKMGSFKEEIRKVEEEMNLAPDISQLDREENRLIALAKKGVDYLSDHFKKLNNAGRVEALLYCTTCLIDLPTDYENSLDMDVKEDRYFLLLHDTILSASDLDNVASFINSRIVFYNEEKEKLANDSFYTPMFIYNAFYLNPLCEKPNVLKEFKESPIELFRLQATLIELELYLEEHRQNIF